MAMPGPGVIGVSGWHDVDWQHDFYAGLPRTDWLRFRARRSTGEETPPDLRFAVEAHRSPTPVRRLLDPVEPVRQERERAEGPSDRLAVVLRPLPASLPRDMGRLERFVRVPNGRSTARHAVEFRHPSWFAADAAACLPAHRASGRRIRTAPLHRTGG